MKLMDYLMFAATKAPDYAKKIAEDLNPKKWQMSVDGVPVLTHGVPKFQVSEIVKRRMLVVKLDYSTADGNHSLVAASRFKNDGTDTLRVDGVEMQIKKQGFDLTTKPFRSYVEVKISFTTPSGAWHEVKLWNKG